MKNELSLELSVPAWLKLLGCLVACSLPYFKCTLTSRDMFCFTLLLSVYSVAWTETWAVKAIQIRIIH